MNLRAAFLALLTIAAVLAAYAVASFQLAYPENGPTGWLLVAAILVVWAIVFRLILRVRKER